MKRAKRILRYHVSYMVRPPGGEWRLEGLLSRGRRVDIGVHADVIAHVRVRAGRRLLLYLPLHTAAQGE